MPTQREGQLMLSIPASRSLVPAAAPAPSDQANAQHLPDALRRGLEDLAEPGYSYVVREFARTGCLPSGGSDCEDVFYACISHADLERQALYVCEFGNAAQWRLGPDALTTDVLDALARGGKLTRLTLDGNLDDCPEAVQRLVELLQQGKIVLKELEFDGTSLETADFAALLMAASGGEHLESLSLQQPAVVDWMSTVAKFLDGNKTLESVRIDAGHEEGQGDASQLVGLLASMSSNVHLPLDEFQIHSDLPASDADGVHAAVEKLLAAHASRLTTLDIGGSTFDGPSAGFLEGVQDPHCTLRLLSLSNMCFGEIPQGGVDDPRPGLVKTLIGRHPSLVGLMLDSRLLDGLDSGQVVEAIASTTLERLEFKPLEIASPLHRAVLQGLQTNRSLVDVSGECVAHSGPLTQEESQLTELRSSLVARNSRCRALAIASAGHAGNGLSSCLSNALHVPTDTVREIVRHLDAGESNGYAAFMKLINNVTANMRSAAHADHISSLLADADPHDDSVALLHLGDLVDTDVSLTRGDALRIQAAAAGKPVEHEVRRRLAQLAGQGPRDVPRPMACADADEPPRKRARLGG